MPACRDTTTLSPVTRYSPRQRTRRGVSAAETVAGECYGHVPPCSFAGLRLHRCRVLLASVSCSVTVSHTVVVVKAPFCCVGSCRLPHIAVAQPCKVPNNSATFALTPARPRLATHVSSRMYIHRHCPFGHLEVNPALRPSGSVPKVRIIRCFEYSFMVKQWLKRFLLILMTVCWMMRINARRAYIAIDLSTASVVRQQYTTYICL